MLRSARRSAIKMTHKFGILFFSLILFCLPLTAVATETEVFFSPNGGCLQAVVAQIDQSTKTIDVAIYHLTSREIAQALVRAKDRGVIIRIFMDTGEARTKYSKSRYLVQNGFDVKLHKGQGLMHHKFAIVDHRVLITGSFNWTPTAEEKNQENLLILRDPELIRKYGERFEGMWRGGG